MNQSFPLFFGLQSTPLELISFSLSLIMVLLNIRQNHWAWLFSILASALYAIVFFQAKLYGDMSLQFVFIAVSIVGWWQWLGGNGDGKQRIPVSRLSNLAILSSGLGCLILFLLIWIFLNTYTDTDVPMADAFLTAGSLLGQILLVRKKIENWIVWIIVDVLYVALYFYKDLHLTAILYGVFILMAVQGYRTWKNNMA
jgi:nicotinamide mononucleotide transporter